MKAESIPETNVVTSKPRLMLVVIEIEAVIRIPDDPSG
jgi:hypothetical protein